MSVCYALLKRICEQRENSKMADYGLLQHFQQKIENWSLWLRILKEHTRNCSWCPMFLGENSNFAFNPQNFGIYGFQNFLRVRFASHIWWNCLHHNGSANRTRRSGHVTCTCCQRDAKNRNMSYLRNRKLSIFTHILNFVTSSPENARTLTNDYVSIFCFSDTNFCAAISSLHYYYVAHTCK